MFQEWEDDWTDSECRDIFNELLEIGWRAFTPQTDACLNDIVDGPWQRSQLVQETAQTLTLKTMVARMKEPERGAFFGVYLKIERQRRNPKKRSGTQHGGKGSTHRNTIKNN